MLGRGNEASLVPLVREEDGRVRGNPSSLGGRFAVKVGVWDLAIDQAANNPPRIALLCALEHAVC